MIQTHAGGDSPFLLQRTFELVANLRAGAFPARWMPDAAFGLGYPFFSYYAILPYYVAAALNLAGFDLLSAIKLTQTLGMLAAAGTMWLYARTLLPKPGAALATLAYTLAPYHLVNLYVRGDSLQEFYAFAWYPLILWSVDRLIWHGEGAMRTKRLWAMLVLAVALAALVLTHNVSSVIFAPFIVLYTLARLVQRARRRQVTLETRFLGGTWFLGLLWLAGAVVLALALSAWFWLPALAEAQGLQLANQTTGYLDFRNHFRAANLVQLNLLFNYQVDSALNVFAIALPQAVLTLLGAIAWLRDRGRRADGVILVTLCALATLMVTPLSKPLWDALPGLPLVQFPWRFLSVQAFFAALLIGRLAGEPPRGQESHEEELTLTKAQSSQRSRATTVGAVRAGIFMLAVGVLALSLPGLPNERLDVRAEDVTAQSLQTYEWFSGNIGTTIRAEYLPASAQPRPMVGPTLLQQPPRALVVDGTVITSTLEQISPVHQLWHIAVGSPNATVTLPLLYWPAWHAALVDTNGTRQSDLPLGPYAGSGWAMLRLPHGEHQVMLTLDGTPLQQTAQTVSLVALLVAIGLIALGASARPAYGARVALVVVAVGFIILASGQVAVALYVPSAATIQVLDYADRQFPNRSSVVMTSSQGESYVLTDVTITPTQVQAGQPFTLSTQWRGGRAPAQLEVEQELPAGGYFAFIFHHARSITTGAPQLSTHIALTDALPGPLLLRLSARDAAGNVYTPTMPGGRELQNEYLAGLTVSQPAPPAATADVIRTFPNGIQLRSVDWYQPAVNDLCFRAIWSVDSSVGMRTQAAALQVSFLLRGADGHEVARADWQPQAGLAPTWSWLPGVPVYDSACVRNVGKLRAGEAYTLLVRWYRVLDQHPSGEVTLVGTRKVEATNPPEAPHALITAHALSAPSVQHQTAVTFSNAIRLLGYDMLTTTRDVSLTLYWTSPVSLTQDEKLFVHLAPVTTPVPVQQADRYTLEGMYPTGMWVPHEVVSETLSLSLDDVPPGAYNIAIGWYDPETLDRLQATTDTGLLPDGRYVLARINH
jgi:hypothetical protein